MAWLLFITCVLVCCPELLRGEASGPGSCDLSLRRHLHAFDSSPLPQCDEDGSLLPVQCRFINMTDRTQIDLLNSYNSFPEAFETFSSFRKFFSLVSSYCFCSDSRGRELQSTGVELLLTDMYDTAFSGLSSGRSFSQSNVYRVLQRRMLGIRLALTGRFRCPSLCEQERQAGMGSGGVFVPSCEPGGSFRSKQCQQGGQCWCVDPTGREVPGTRQMGDSLVCGSGSADCPSRRRLALSRLFSGSVGPVSEASSGPAASCLSLLRPLRDLLPEEADPTSFLSLLIEVLHGTFPSVGGALEALTRSPPARLQENLFGGKFLKSAAAFNFSGVVGGLGPDQLSPLQRYQNLVRSVSRALEDPTFLSALQQTLKSLSSPSSAPLDQVLTPLLRSCSDEEEDSSFFLPRCTPSGAFQEVQCQGPECWCVDYEGQEVLGSRTVGRPSRCPSPCERALITATKKRSNMAAGAELHLPVCSEGGDFLPLQCAGSRCFCVDADGNPTTEPTEGAVTCPEKKNLKPGSSAGLCSQALSEVTAFTQELKSIVALSNSSHIPLGYGFLLAEGLSLTPEELQISQSEEEMQISDRLLSRTRSALRLAAFSTVKMLTPPHRRSYRLFVPQCEADGSWKLVQCSYSTGQCWCVDEDGDYISGSLSSRSTRLPNCPTRCQRAEARSLLSDWMKGSDISATSAYRPQCEPDGGFSVLQTSGASGWCVNPQTGETIQTATLSPSGQLTCPSWCELQGLECRPDGAFAPLQCDVTSCWCVYEDGQEVGGTRTARQTGRTPSCDRPLCPAPSITHGALVCRPAADGRQSCELVCYRGYQNSLPVSSFLCETGSGQWGGDNKPLGGACQSSQPLQTVWSSQIWMLSSSCSQISTLQSLLFSLMTSRGLCSAQFSSSGRSVSLCDDSSVGLRCDGASVRLTLRWTAALSDLPTSELPDLHDVALFLNESRLLDGVQDLLGDLRSALTSEPKLVYMTTPSFGCSRGFHLNSDGEGCLLCPAGSFSQEGACLLCPQGTYQEEEGRDFCNKCPRGSSPAGASSVNQCETDCQRRSLRCSERGDFLPVQSDLQSNRWSCFSIEGAELEWTTSEKPLTDDECTVLSRFQTVPGSDLVLGAQNTEVLQTLTSDLTACVQECAAEPSCHHVALFNTQCELYSTNTQNTVCRTSQQTSGFMGNPQAESFDQLTCSLRVRGGASDLLVLRKKGAEFSVQRTQQQSFVRLTMTRAVSGVFRTQVFSSRRTSLTDAHRFCQDGCSRDACCDGFILNHNTVNGGSLLCGWLRAPSVLMCDEQDWDVIGQGPANRSCGAGLTYNKELSEFVLNFGGETFTFAESAVPNDRKNEDYQASIIRFNTIYLNTDPAGGSGSGSGSCSSSETAPLTASDQNNFESLSNEDVLVDPQRRPPALSFWLNKKNYNSQQALQWCLSRCEEEERCSVADLRDAESDGFLSCSLYPDTGLCGAFDSELGRSCSPVLHRAPDRTYRKKVDLRGPVKTFYEPVPFQKLLSPSIRSWTTMKDNTRLSEGFTVCERLCDQDPCCRGFGFVRYIRTSEVVCLPLTSFGLQTCSEDDMTTWRTQDCRTSELDSKPEPFGWYQKPVDQWTLSPGLCPPSSLPDLQTKVSMDEWHSVPDSAVLVDPTLSTYDVIHVSRDLASDQNRTRAWCLNACQEAESCVAVSLRETRSATRCVLYPDTVVCGLSSSPSSSSPASSCRLVLKEPASRVYQRTGPMAPPTSLSIPGHGSLQGAAVDTVVGSETRTVVQFLGVPYARPPIGPLRFEAAQPADWTGTWEALRPRPSCVQPGDMETSASSEDCLYLNVFAPAAQRAPVPVLLYFFNPTANQNPGLLDGSALAALGNMVVVTASYRTAALGFLRTGDLRGNYGLSDQEAALRWVNAHISLVGGDKKRVTVGAERSGADLNSLHLLSSSSSLFQRMILMGGSIFSPSLVQSDSSSRSQVLDLARELGCVTSDLSDGADMVSCLRSAPVQQLNAAQTKLLAVSGPFQTWSPVRQSVSQVSSLPGVDLLLGTSVYDGLISRARRIKDFEALQGRANSKTAFYAALSRSLGGASENQLLKEAANWFYSLDHSPTPAGYNLFSRALNNATRDLFIFCPTLKMAAHWANSSANVFLYHQPETSAYNRADYSVPLDLQFMFGTPLHPMSFQRFSSSDRRLSLAAMTYVSSFVRTGNPNPSRAWPESVLPRWQPVLSSEAPPTYLELNSALQHQQGLSQNACSFWTQLGPRLTTKTGVSGAEPVQLSVTLDLPVDSPSSQSEVGYN
ncbi:thyroglobulin [Austrofundulus limnaeus]|uniref:Thyroglobulin n=1 Tax=Austrofundulus limnaeus TaxID=52670 RepID=A0A2I4CCC7_AUSLI|nr:PREDICTED: thyroglobulin [Austrofundulus limnaeus]